MKAVFVVAFAFLTVLFFTGVNAQTPLTISYQGLLTDSSGAPKPNGSYTFIFRIYDTLEGSHELWRESKQLEVKRGLFSASLGDVLPFEGLIDFSRQYWLGIQVGADPELSPRVRLNAVAYSFHTIKADSAARSLYADTSVFAQSAGIPNGVVVRSLNGLHDHVILSGAGGATVTSNGDSIFIAASGGNGTGIQGVQNTNNTLDILDANGPTATINLKLPFSAGTATSATTFEVSNGSTGIGLFGFSAGGDGIYGGSANPAKSGVWGENTGGGFGVAGSTGGAGTAGVWGSNSGSGFGVQGTSSSGIGVYGQGTGLTGYGGYFVGRAYFSSNVGIGTTSPQAPLHVANRIRIGNDPTYPGVYGEIRHDGSNTGFVINAAAGGGWADIHLQTDGTTRMFIESQGNVGIGTTTPTQKLDVNGNVALQELFINGGADMAEPFSADDAAAKEPGTIVVLDPDTPGKVDISTVPYDSRVAGVVSGAGGVKPGLTLRQERTMDGNIPVAIAGRVYCKAVGPIAPGDLLTTSAVPGRAMKAADRGRSHGAIIGKAMSRLGRGAGLVLVLVNLQ